MDVKSRLEVSALTRNTTEKSQAIRLLKEGAQQFETALTLDPDYILAEENIYYTNIALAHMQEKEGKESKWQIYMKARRNRDGGQGVDVHAGHNVF